MNLLFTSSILFSTLASIVLSANFRVPSSGCHPRFRQRLTKLINKLRKEHGAPPLTISTALNEYSQKWADEVLSGKYQVGKGQVLHQPSNRYTFDLVVSRIFDMDSIESGGNGLIFGGGGGGGPPTVEFTADQAFKYILANQTYPWYGREPLVDYFYKYAWISAVLWASSSRLGIGCTTKTIKMPKSGGKAVALYIVVNTDPPGNQACGYKYNVLPKSGTPLYWKLTRGRQVPDPVCQKTRRGRSLPAANKGGKKPPKSVDSSDDSRVKDEFDQDYEDMSKKVMFDHRK